MTNQHHKSGFGSKMKLSIARPEVQTDEC